jgi:hypothetical protein
VSKLILQKDLGATGVKVNEDYKLYVAYDPDDESVWFANGKKWKMLRHSSALSVSQRKTWNKFIEGVETPVNYFCNASFNISSFCFDYVTNPACICFMLETPPYETRRELRARAVMASSHARLGANSELSVLPPEIMRKIIWEHYYNDNSTLP